MAADPTIVRAGPKGFRAALAQVPAGQRDAWFDAVCGIEGVPDDDARLPRGCVPYLPCAVATLLDMIDLAEVREADVFVDIGAGIGRAAAFTHLLTGAACIGVEIQPQLARAARRLTERLDLSRVRVLEGDAAELTDHIASGTVFFLYCPFGGQRLGRVLDALEPIARTRPIRVCCVDLPLPSCRWLAQLPTRSPELTVYRSTLAPATTARTRRSSTRP